MKRFDTFGAYMFDLLFAPLKRGKRAANQFFIFFKVIGRIFDGMKKDAFRLRDELNVATASPVMLPVHGQDRDMPRLEGESVENYRARLSMKGIISEWGGTKSGILYALTSLGYEQSTIEPFSYQDPERWAEFIVFLKGSKQSGVNNLAVIDAEVRKVKEGSSKPAYGEALRSTRRPFPASRGIRVAGKLFAASGPGWSVSGTFWRPKFTRAALRAPARSSSRRWERSRPPKSSINRAPLLCMRVSPLIWRWARRQAPARRSTPFVLRCFAAPG